MIVKRSEADPHRIERCHEGLGALQCTELLAEYRREGPGIKFCHDDVLEPGASIGEHRHDGDEEVYVILDGRGTAVMDGRRVPVGPGDLMLTRSGHTHGLINSPDAPMRLIVVGVNC
jgi:mannose-6-phosphate isomerase-like protein (cupin superfamily)